MNRIILLQVVVLAVISVFCGLVFGLAGLGSAFVGGLSYLVPTCAAILLLKLFQSPAVQGKALVLGVALKIVLSLAIMLFVFVLWHEELIFLPFFAGLLSVSHFVFLALLRVKNYGR